MRFVLSKKKENNKDQEEIIDSFIQLSTGEVYDIHHGDSFKITTASQKDAIKKAYETKTKNNEMKEINNHLGGFVFALFKYSDILFKDISDITQDDIVKLFYLATYVNYKGYFINDDNQYLQRHQLQKILGLNRNNFDLFYNKMKRLNILSQDNDKNIIMNKNYFLKGELTKEIEKYYDYTRVYIKSIRYLYENVPKRKHKQLGNYFKMIPFVHRQKNILCWNPNDKVDNIQILTVNDLKDILGIHRHTARAFINELLDTRLENGEAIVVFIKNNKDDGQLPILVNPNVFYGGNFNIKEGRNGLIKWFYNN